ncbi:CCXG family PEP-CTERM protein [Thalassolituus sp. LLYu03]|uniref:CCXG family PEP-CTERM protein n=1 Tax=Thalassolituus sp. LLYu03 TaxID=3421656 RepID=UPI003D28DAA3
MNTVTQRMRILMSLALLVFFGLTAPGSYAFDTSWPYKTQFTLNNNSGSSLSGRPIRMTLTSSSLHADYTWSSDGRDLRVTDADQTTELSFEIESWDAAAKTASIVLRIPTFNGSSHVVYLFYGNTAASSAASTLGTSISGILYHTRYNNRSNNPESLSAAESAFNASGDNTSGYGKTYLQDFSSIQNSTAISGGLTTDYILLTESRFVVDDAKAGTWQFRAGMDFGLGSGMYVDGQPLFEVWSGYPEEDLWWGGSWTDPDVMQGTINLTAGVHTFKIIGAEGTNGGASSIEFSSDNGSTWRAYSTAELTITSDTDDVYDAGTPGGTSSDNLVAGTDLIGLLTDESNYLSPGDAFSLQLTPKNQGQNSFDTQYCTRYRNGSCRTYSDNLTSTVTFPNGINYSSYSGTSWSCSYTSNNRRLTCTYQGDQTIPGGGYVTPLTISVTVAGSATLGNTLTVSSTVALNESNKDVDTGNNTDTALVYLVDGHLEATGTSCASGISLSNGLWTRFYDTEATTYATTEAAMQSLVDTYANSAHLYGQTIFNDISGTSFDGTGNPFDDDGSKFGYTTADEYYLTIFKGYLYIPTSGIWSFAVDGDDAVELRLNGDMQTERYGPNPAANSPQKSVDLYMEAGYHSLEFRHQEYAGNDSYYLYWKAPGSSSYSTVSAANLYQCDLYTQLQLTSQNTVTSDPVNGASNAKAIPGALVTVSVLAENQGTLTPDADTLTITQALPADAEFYFGSSTSNAVQVTDGSGSLSSGVALANVLYANTDLDSSAADSAFNYSPSGEYDTAVRTLRLKFSGVLNPASGSDYPQFTYQYRLRLK